MRVLADIGRRLPGARDLDREQLAALLGVQRRAGLGVAVAGPSDGKSRAHPVAFYMKFALFTLFGVTGVAGLLLPSLFIGLTFSYTLIMLMLGLTLLNYFTAVLLDTSDNRILLHLPVSGRTLLAARIICIARYAGLLSVAISLPTALAIAVRLGAVALLIFVLSLILMLILIAAATLAIGLSALRFMDPARIRRTILYLETTLFVVAIYAGSMVLNASVPLAQLTPDVSQQAWWYFYPPAWMAGLLHYSLVERTAFNAVLAGTALVVPIVGFVACVVLFAGQRFTALLARLEGASRTGATSNAKPLGWFDRLWERVVVILNPDREQRATFELTAKLMKADQTLKLTAYPYIGTILVNIGFLVWKFRDTRIDELPLTGELTFLTCYYVPLLLAIIGPLIQYSAEWRAAWCYQVLPFAQPSAIVRGAMKAYMCKYLLPVYVVLLIVSGAVWGGAAALDALYATGVAILICIQRFANVVFPYSKETVSSAPTKGGNGGRLAFIPIALGLIATHVLLKTIAGGWGVACGIIALSAAIGLAYKKLRLLEPKTVEAPDHHVGWHRT